MESPVIKIKDTGTDAAKTVKPTLTASSFGIFAAFIITVITDIIRKALDHGFGIRRDKISVSTKIPIIILLHDLTNFKMYI